MFVDLKRDAPMDLLVVVTSNQQIPDCVLKASEILSFKKCLIFDVEWFWFFLSFLMFDVVISCSQDQFILIQIG
jgi:hypothetical protein